MGTRTISCYINGKLWQNSESDMTIGGANQSSFSALGGDNNLYYGVSGIVWNESVLYLMAVNSRLDDSTEYVLDNSIGNVSFLLDKKEKNTITFINKNNVKYLSKENEGVIRIIRSYSGNTLKSREGYFEATLYNENDPTDVLHITDGRCTKTYK
ncbi:MAG: hypothetical protein ACPGSD_08850 [Flavobacteriales bacterium]